MDANFAHITSANSTKILVRLGTGTKIHAAITGSSTPNCLNASRSRMFSVGNLNATNLRKFEGSLCQKCFTSPR